MRTGLGRFAIIVHMMCKLFGTWRGSIIQAVNSHPTLTAEQKNQLLGLVNTIDTACSAVDVLLVRYER